MPLRAAQGDDPWSWSCSFYDNGGVTVGTRKATRFTIKVPADEGWWFSTRLRAELIDLTRMVWYGMVWYGYGMPYPYHLTP